MISNHCRGQRGSWVEPNDPFGQSSSSFEIECNHHRRVSGEILKPLQSIWSSVSHSITHYKLSCSVDLICGIGDWPLNNLTIWLMFTWGHHCGVGIYGIIQPAGEQDTQKLFTTIPIHRPKSWVGSWCCSIDWLNSVTVQDEFLAIFRKYVFIESWIDKKRKSGFIPQSPVIIVISSSRGTYLLQRVTIELGLNRSGVYCSTTGE